MKCGEGYQYFWSIFNSIHPILLLVICAVGVITNILNLIIFTRPSMRRQATNIIFSALVTADLLFVLQHPLQVVLNGRLEGSQYGDLTPSHGSQVRALIGDFCFWLFHSWSIYLTLILALWRWAGVSNPIKSKKRFTPKAAKMAVGLAVTISTSMVLLQLIDVDIVQVKGDEEEEFVENLTSTTSTMLYRMDRGRIGYLVSWWIFALGIKIIPCAIMTIASCGLVRSLVSAARMRRRDILTRCVGPKEAAKSQKAEMGRDGQFGDEEEEGEEFEKITRMLLVILTLFVVTELPKGIMRIVDVIIYTREFQSNCYQPINPFLNLNEYVSSAVSFFIYLRMSQQFRLSLSTIWATFVKKIWYN